MIQMLSTRIDSFSMLNQGYMTLGRWFSDSGGGEVTIQIPSVTLTLSPDCALGRHWRIETGSTSLLPFFGLSISTHCPERSVLHPPLLNLSTLWFREYKITLCFIVDPHLTLNLQITGPVPLRFHPPVRKDNRGVYYEVNKANCN
jgi:hypothetical protein